MASWEKGRFRVSLSRRILLRVRRWVFFLSGLGLGVTLGALLLAYVLAGDIYDYQDSVDGAKLPDVDAVVCLAGGRGRISAAGDIWYRYWETIDFDQPGKAPLPPVLYISGMGPKSTWAVFAKQLRRGVLNVIRPENVVLETESGNTEANAVWLARYAREHGWKKILLMTSPYHMKRARIIFAQILHKEGVQLGVETLSVFQDPFEPGEWRDSTHAIRVTMLEYLKWLYYKNFWKP